MADAGRRAGAFLGALAIVAGVIAIAAFLIGLAGGEASARGAIGAALGVAAVVLVPRAVPVSRLLGGYSALIYAFLFLPIVVVVVYAFNSGTNVAAFSGFSTRWFSAALQDESITSAVTRSLQIAVGSRARGHRVRHGGGAGALARGPARARALRRAASSSRSWCPSS